MFRKIMYTLGGLILLLILAVFILLFVVNPNQYKGMITSVMKEKTGYELTINGDLRWHLWPKISILTNGVVMTAPDAEKPIITADNMRLDIDLMSLLSKEVAVNKVLINSATINLTDESKGKRPAKKIDSSTTDTQIQSTEKNTKVVDTETSSPWNLVLDDIDITNSTLVFLYKDERVTVRNIQLGLKRQGKVIDYLMKGEINRDLTNIIYDLDGDIDLTDYPKTAALNVEQFSYQLTGFDKMDHLSGSLSGTVTYQADPFEFSSNNLLIEQEENSFEAQVKVNLSQKPYFAGNVYSKKVNLDAFLADANAVENLSTGAQAKNQVNPQSNALKAQNQSKNPFSFLTLFDADLKIKIDELQMEPWVLTHLNYQMKNRDGVSTLTDLSGEVAKGKFTATASVNGKSAIAKIQSKTKIQGINLAELASILSLKNPISGQFYADANVSMSSNDLKKPLAQLTGYVDAELQQAQLLNINVNQIVSGAIQKVTDAPISNQSLNDKMVFSKIKMAGNLNKGVFNANTLTAHSDTIDITGGGVINFISDQLDLNLNIKLLNGWNSHNKIIQSLQGTLIPLRLFGAFEEIHYQLDIEKLIKNTLKVDLKDKLKEKLNKELNRGQSQENNPKKELADKVIKGLFQKL